MERVADLLSKKTGIHLAERKLALVENRLTRLSGKIGYKGGFEELVSLIESGHHEEEFINAFTTNLTSFFRESAQFDDFLGRFLKEYGHQKPSLSILCAGCSSGEEPYSAGICYLHAKNEGIYNGVAKITAVDIDSEKLTAAKTGVYQMPHKNPFPLWVKEWGFFEIKDDNGHKKIFIKENLKKIISFEKHNLASHSEQFKNSFYDAVFCRNTLIYFNKEKQLMILNKLLSALKIGGTLYLGHSENPLELTAKLQKKGHNIYVKKGTEGEA